MKKASIGLFVTGILIPCFAFTIAGFEPIRQQAVKDFNERVIPAISEQFARFNAFQSSAYQGEIARAERNLEANLAVLEARYTQYWAHSLQLEKMGQLVKNQAEYDYWLSEVRSIVSTAKRAHSEAQKAINNGRLGGRPAPVQSELSNPNNIKVIIIDFLMQVGTPTAWILLKDLEQQNYLM